MNVAITRFYAGGSHIHPAEGVAQTTAGAARAVEGVARTTEGGSGLLKVGQDEVGVGVGDGVGVGVGVGDSVGDGVGLAESVGEADGEALGDAEGDADSLSEGKGSGVMVGDAEGEGEADEEGEGESEGDAGGDVGTVTAGVLPGAGEPERPALGDASGVRNAEPESTGLKLAATSRGGAADDACGTGAPDAAMEAACDAPDRDWACVVGAEGTTVRARIAAAEAATMPPPTPADASGPVRRCLPGRPRRARSRWPAVDAASVPDPADRTTRPSAAVPCGAGATP